MPTVERIIRAVCSNCQQRWTPGAVSADPRFHLGGPPVLGYPLRRIAVDQETQEIRPRIVPANIGQGLGGANGFHGSLGDQNRFAPRRTRDDLAAWVNNIAVAGMLEYRQFLV